MDKIVEYSVLLGIFASIAMIFFLLIYIVKKPSIFDKLIASDLLAMPLMCLIVLVSMYYKTIKHISGIASKSLAINLSKILGFLTI